jgi:hypothetical protein
MAIVVAALLALIAGLIGYRMFHRPTTVVGVSPTDVPRASLTAVDHSAFDALLQKYVDRQGFVAYAGWKADPGDVKALDDYLAQLGRVDLAAAASRAAQLAYWINAYNALTLKGVLGVYPTDSIRSHASALRYDPRLKVNLWYDLYLQAGDRQVNLTDIEHKILRPMGDPRIHFGLVCASRGCPPLRMRAYTADNVEAALDDNARRFFAREENFQADSENRSLHFSELLKWYDTDFGRTSEEVVQRVRPFLPEAETLDWLDRGGFRVEYDLRYEWDLNDQGR